MKSPIGGYFEWELQGKLGNFPHSNGALLNSGRHALEYILTSIGQIDKIYIPYFTCEVVLEPIIRQDINYVFYHINSSLEIDGEIELSGNEYIIYTNYFGIKDSYAKCLSERYHDQLIIDNAQALFAKQIVECHQFYSPRKFVGCPDGGIAVSSLIDIKNSLPQGKSYDKCDSLLQRVDEEISLGHASFRNVSKIISSETMQKMSTLTQGIISNIDYAKIENIRRANFNYLNSSLASTNKLSNLTSTAALVNVECPMVYPYWTDDINLRQKLIDNKVFVAKYWPNVVQWSSPSDLEYQLTQQIIPLPIDQRYGQQEMDFIISLI